MVDPDFFPHRINVHLLAKLRANMIYRKIKVALKRFHWSSSRSTFGKTCTELLLKILFLSFCQGDPGYTGEVGRTGPPGIDVSKMINVLNYPFVI